MVFVWLLINLSIRCGVYLLFNTYFLSGRDEKTPVVAEQQQAALDIIDEVVSAAAVGETNVWANVSRNNG